LLVQPTASLQAECDQLGEPVTPGLGGALGGSQVMRYHRAMLARYFGLAQTPEIWRKLDEWLRQRLRSIQLKHCKRPRTM